MQKVTFLFILLTILPKKHTSIIINKQWRSIKNRLGTCSDFINLIPHSKCLLEESIFSGSTSNIFLITFHGQVRILKVQHPTTRSKEELDFLKLTEDTPNVNRLYFCREKRSFFLMVLDFGSRRSLENLVLNDPKFQDQDFLLDTFETILRTVTELHNKLVLHQDLNPRNIVFDEDYRPIIIDFNTAREMFQNGSIKGPLECRPPETFGLVAIFFQPSYDVYSLGVTLYFMLFGRYPFVQYTANYIHFDQVYLPLGVEKVFGDLLLKMLAPLSKRGSTQELLQIIEESKLKSPLAGALVLENRKFYFGGDSLESVSDFEILIFNVKYVFWGKLKLFLIIFVVVILFVWKLWRNIFD